jgi:hypothetical protein
MKTRIDHASDTQLSGCVHRGNPERRAHYRRIATSITAFIGRALRGPVDEPVKINSFGDFERAAACRWAARSAVRDCAGGVSKR